MKILQIDVNCKGSSTGKIAYDLYSYAASRGAECAVCYGRGPRIKEKNIYKFGLDWETDLHALLTRLTGRTGCYSFFSTRRLIRFIKRFRPDVIHIHELHAYFVNIKPLLNFIAKAQIPAVWTFHCEFMYTGKCGHADECTRFTSGCGNCPQLGEYPKTLFFDRTAKMFAEKKALFEKLQKLVIVTPSAWLKERVKLSFLKDRDVRVVHNGIDTEIFRPRNADALRKEYHIAADEKVVLSVAPDIRFETCGKIPRGEGEIRSGGGKRLRRAPRKERRIRAADPRSGKTCGILFDGGCVRHLQQKGNFFSGLRGSAVLRASRRGIQSGRAGRNFLAGIQRFCRTRRFCFDRKRCKAFFGKFCG